MSTWTRKQLQAELDRRQLYPPCDTHDLLEQAITAATLEAELALVPFTDPSRTWHEWELALAQEHERLYPGTPYVRYIEQPS